MIRAAVIPARGGSKRLPRKNILEVAGLPMLAHPLRAARSSGLFDKVFVSTEDLEIAEIASLHGADIIWRPPALAGDRSTVIQVCLHTLDVYPEIGHLCCIYSTAIFLQPESIVAAYDLLNSDPEADFVMGVSEYEYPPVQALKADEKGYLSNMWPEWRDVQSQFQPHLLVSNGSIYWARADALRAEMTFYGCRLKGYLLPPEQALDINTPDDLERARLLLENQR